MKIWKTILTGIGVEKPPTSENENKKESNTPELTPKQEEIQRKREEIMKKMLDDGAEIKQGHRIKSDTKRKGTFTKKSFWATEKQKEEARKEMEKDLASRGKKEPPKNPKEVEVSSANKEKLVLVDKTRDIKAEARDRALSNMTASREELKGFKGFLKKVWKHNLFYDYYLTKETYKSEEEIRDEYENDEAAIERFASEYEEAIHKEAGERIGFEGLDDETEKKLKDGLKGIVLGFAKGDLDESSFMEEKNRLLMEVRGEKDAAIYADNLLDVARHLESRVKHEKSLDALDDELEFVIGEARGGVRTEASLSNVEKIIDKIQKTKVGRFANEATIATAVSLAYSLSAGASRRIAGSRLAAALTFGGTAVLAGGVAGLRESRRLKIERAQHMRERAKGEEFEEDAERRKEMDEFAYEILPAKSFTEKLDSYLKKENLTAKDLTDAVSDLSEAEARIRMSDREGIDLLGYSSDESIDKERLELDIARAKLKVRLRKLDQKGELDEGAPSSYKDFEKLLTDCIEVKSSAIRKGERGLDSVDQAFTKYRRKKVAKAVVKAGTIGAILGMTAQEVSAEIRGDQQGVAEGLRGIEKESRNLTPVEALRQWFDTPSPDSRTELFEATEFNELSSEELGLGEGTTYKMPRGFALEESGDSYNILQGDKVILEDVSLNIDGTLTNESLETMREAGFDINIKGTFVEVSEETLDVPAEDVPSNIGGEAETSIRNISTEEFIAENQEQFTEVHRVAWYDNDTPGVFDKNELALHWGGPEGTGIGEEGEYVLDVSSMTSEGSFTDGLSIDAQNAVKEGRLSMLFSMDKGTQDFAWKVPINEDGEAIINPDSEMGKLLFSKDPEGRAVFNGKYAEVAETVSKDDGVENVRLLATHSGDGIESVEVEETILDPGESGEGDVPDVEKENNPEFKQLTEYDIDYKQELEVPLGDATVEAPPVVPLTGRSPLESVKDEGPNQEEEDEFQDSRENELDEGNIEEGEPEDVLKISGSDSIVSALNDKLETYKKRMDERKQWLDRDGLNPNRAYEDAYFKASLVEELLSKKMVDTRDVEKRIEEEYGDKMNKDKFQKAVKFLREFIDKNDANISKTEEKRGVFKDVIGVDVDEGGVILDEYRERFNNQELDYLTGLERAKTEDEEVIIKLANEETNKLLEKYGVEPLDIPVNNIHIIKEEVWRSLQEEGVITKDTEAIYNAQEQGIAIVGQEDAAVFTESILHELLHFKSHQILQRLRGADSVRVRNLGITSTSRDGSRRYFNGWNEAVTEELTRRLFKEIEKSKPMSGKISGDYESGYSAEKEVLSAFIDKLYERNKSKFKNKEDVFNLFARGALAGETKPIVDLVNNTFGKGTTSKFIELDDDVEAQMELIDSL
ncbi:MAG: hypothetical protein R3346_02375 [Candidatus Spechtbacterales bacterium]|nr:hypothetical protein [Candidatus Spechtbacterales bacterium]